MLKNIYLRLPRVLETVLSENCVQKRFAGHSKWQNIRHIKGQKDLERNKLFTKINRQIKIAVQEGGSVDPKMNIKLAQALEQARRSNMPAASIQNVLKQCQNDKTKGSLQLFDIRGPSGSFILCEIFSSQNQVIKNNIATILKKLKFKYSEGSGLHLFDEKGIIEAEAPANASGDILESATDHAIESGAEDVKLFDDKYLQFTCGKTNVTTVAAKLEEAGYTVISASVEFVPNQLAALQDAEMEQCQTLYEKLGAIPEVTRLADNIA